MNIAFAYAIGAAILFCIGTYGLLSLRHMLRKIIALNICSAAVFMLMIALAARDPDAMGDPVPHAMVLTGIVVSISVTALALALASRIHAATGRVTLPEDEFPPANREAPRQ